MRRLLMLGVSVGAASAAMSQTPTNQDCLGAIPICSPVYVTSSATFGTGNYPAEHPPVTCLVPGEYNSLWFIFTVIASGNLAFEIVPVNPTADYDWALYNLTNATCADIKTNSSLSVSCNSSQYGYTGISATGVGNWNGPGPTNAFNYLYPVTAGETYVLNVNNWSGTLGGYTINFSNSTATIFDSVKPNLSSVAPLTCGADELTFSFSEKVLCNSVSAADFQLTGPGGTHVITSVTGAACTVGGTQEVTFTASVTPPLQIGGTYYLSLTAAAGSVEDLCGNLADTVTLAFVLNGVNITVDSIVQPYCGGNNGAIFTSLASGTPPLSFTLNGSPAPSGTFVGLNGGTFVIQVSDASGCTDTAQVTLLPPTGAVEAQLLHSTLALCADSCDASVLVGASGGVPPYSFQWSSGASTAGVAQLCAGSYTVTVTDLMGCVDSLQVSIGEPPPLIVQLDSIRHISCAGSWDGYLAMKVSGGTPPYFYYWLPYGGNSKIADQLNANTYTFQVKDANGCLSTYTITLNEPPPLQIANPGEQWACLSDKLQLEASVSGGTPPYAVVWADGSIQPSYSITVTGDTSFTAQAIDANGCISPVQTFTIKAIWPPTIDLGSDTTLCLGQTLEYSFYHPNASYLWQDGTTTGDYTIREPGMYWLQAMNSCFTIADTINITMHDCSACLIVPDAFTPNGDGINDVFLPITPCTLTHYRFSIFNRWGTLVFYTENPNQGWDGQVQHLPAEMGTYVWVSEYSGSVLNQTVQRQQKGYVVLIR